MRHVHLIIPVTLFVAASALATTATASAPGEGAKEPSLLHTTFGDFKLKVPGEVRAFSTYVSSFPIDRDETESETGPYVDTRLELGLELTRASSCCPWGFKAVYRHEFLVGTMVGRPELEGEGLPHEERAWQKWKEGFVEVSYQRWVRVAVGLQTNRWGLGLLANNTDHGAEFGSGRFSIPVDADQSLRVALTVLPFLQTNSSLKGLAFFVAGDRVWEDANARYLDDDKAYQGIGAIKWIHGKDTDIGAYMARRLQTDASGREVRVTAVDAAGQFRFDAGGGDLVGGAEVASVRGTTTRAPSFDYPRHDVAQFGAAATAGFEMDDAGAWVDFVYATGDQNPFDADQNAFYANKSFDLGLLMFEELVAYQTGRSVHTASDPNYIGIPPEDVEQLASRGRITNAIVVSPRASYRPIKWLETYGRPIFAWTSVPWTDPFNTNINGGAQRNALNADPGRYYGTEVDLGVRAYHANSAFDLMGGLEGGVVFPGSAFARPDGNNMDPVYGARLHMRARF